jgi:plastocyanin
VRTCIALSVLAALAAASSVGLAAAALPAVQREHRLHLPPPVAPTLPSSLAVDEDEYTLRPSQIVLARGQVKINVYNRGMDDHDLTVVDGHGATRQIALEAGQSGTLIVALEPGSYRLFCSLFAGTPESHDALGMHNTVEVR